MKHSKTFENNIDELVQETSKVQPIAIDQPVELDMADYIYTHAENKKLLSYIEELEAENKRLSEVVQQQNKELTELHSKFKHNARNAGRKPFTQSQAYFDFIKLFESGVNLKTISAKLKISLRTCYYYKNAYLKRTEHKKMR